MSFEKCLFCKQNYHSIRLCANPLAVDACFLFHGVVDSAHTTVLLGQHVDREDEVGLLARRLQETMTVAQLRLLCCCRNALAGAAGGRALSTSVRKSAAAGHLASYAVRVRYDVAMWLTTQAPRVRAALAQLADSQAERHRTSEPRVGRHCEAFWRAFLDAAGEGPRRRAREPLLQYVPSLPDERTWAADATCPVCFERLAGVREVVSLQCNHSFCGVCTQRMHDTQQQRQCTTFSCAVCRGTSERARVFALSTRQRDARVCPVAEATPMLSCP